MSVQQTMTDKLTAAFAPDKLLIENESARHAHHKAMQEHPGGHAGEHSGETHFRIHIVAPSFNGKPRLERHRMINQVLAEELAGPVHALAIHAYAPGEGNAE